MSETLLSVVTALLDESRPEYFIRYRYEVSPTIFARRPWRDDSPALVHREDAVGLVSVSAPDFAYVLEVEIAQEVLAVWASWRDGREPNAQEAVAAILHYASHDAYQPVG